MLISSQDLHCGSGSVPFGMEGEAEDGASSGKRSCKKKVGSECGISNIENWCHGQKRRCPPTEEPHKLR